MYFIYTALYNKIILCPFVSWSMIYLLACLWSFLLVMNV